MKKIVFILVCVMVMFAITVPCFAEEVEIEAETEAETELETDAETEEEAEELMPDWGEIPFDEVTQIPEVGPVVDEDAIPDTDEAIDDAWDAFMAKITDSATWTMIGAALVTIVTTIGTVTSKFKSIASLVGNKADTETVKGELKSLEKEIKQAYNTNHKEVADTMKRYEEALKTTQTNEQKLYAILTLFMTNCKISESAKAEILGILADVKTYSGSAIEFVEQAQKAINKEVEEKEAMAEPTPALDQLLEEDYMELG